jgi:Domain of unknown function (DUF4395)
MFSSLCRRIPFSFPNPVDEVSARLVATGVVSMGSAYLLLQSPWILALLTYGFAARVMFGPRFSPLGRFVTQAIRPRVSVAPKFVAGAPKRFAQGVGFAFSGGALMATVLGAPSIAFVLIAGLVFAASLEAFVGFCLGCLAFRYLMQFGVIPESMCASCNDISEHLARVSAGTSRSVLGNQQNAAA